MWIFCLEYCHGLFLLVTWRKFWETNTVGSGRRKTGKLWIKKKSVLFIFRKVVSPYVEKDINISTQIVQWSAQHYSTQIVFGDLAVEVEIQC